MEMEPGPIILLSLIVLAIGGVLFRNLVWDKRKQNKDEDKTKQNKDKDKTQS